MKKVYQLMMMSLLALGSTFFFASCNDDDEINEWTDVNYVSLLPADYLRPVPTFSLTHAEGQDIEGTVEYQYMITTQKPAPRDIVVDIDVTCNEISSDKINVSANRLTIAAGSTVSDTITLKMEDWSELKDIKEEKELTLKITATHIASDAEVVLTDFRKELNVKIVKAAERPKTEVMLTNPKEWIFAFMEGVENANSNSVAGTGSGDVATNGVAFWVTIDFLKEKELTGIYTKHYGTPYCPTKIELFSSKDGNNWESIGVFETGKKASQIVKFDQHVNTRYLKYQMIDVPARVDIVNLYVYAWQ